MWAGWISLLLGLLFALATVTSGPMAFGGRWVAYFALLGAGILNVIIGIYVLTRKRAKA